MNIGTKDGAVIGSAPEQGSFPLDRLHECDKFVEEYFGCLRKFDYYAPKCRLEAQVYLLCRRKKGIYYSNLKLILKRFNERFIYLFFIFEADDFKGAAINVPEFNLKEYQKEMEKENQDIRHKGARYSGKK
eukprot:gene1395-12015_t